MVNLSFNLVFYVLFKQKTAYEMRISDWSSDVCSSDLRVIGSDFRRSGAVDAPGVDDRSCINPIGVQKAGEPLQHGHDHRLFPIGKIVEPALEPVLHHVRR